MRDGANCSAAAIVATLTFLYHTRVPRKKRNSNEITVKSSLLLAKRLTCTIKSCHFGANYLTRHVRDVDPHASNTCNNNNNNNMCI